MILQHPRPDPRAAEALAREFLAEAGAAFHELKAGLRRRGRSETQAHHEAWMRLQRSLLAHFLADAPASPDPAFASLGRYPFTLSERYALDREVAIDPEVLGLAAERLAGEEPGAAGVFYTPRVEIDLMCRLALADHLITHLGEGHRHRLYAALFALGPDEEAAADRALAEADLWPSLTDRLRRVTVLDPACGAGSFLVGMLRLLDGLQARAAAYLGRNEAPHRRRQRIIGQNLYGVEVMAPACQVAELRLKLAVLAGVEPSPQRGKGQPARQLPQIACNIQLADSLTQPVFPEITAGGRGGFDLVIGNPPYVRQEHIADPRPEHDEITPQAKKDYKTRLARSVYRSFPAFFAGRKLDARSDLYIYFYFRGLSLLNPAGTFCFLTANAWLDAGYGATLQEFLLRHCRLKLVLDNQARRSFTRAGVNTVILLASAPAEAVDGGLENVVRFANIRQPFERLFSAATFEAITNATERRTTPDYRIFPIRQGRLLEAGCALLTGAIRQEHNLSRSTSGSPDFNLDSYRGDQWGGKYLRAPDIYQTLIHKGREMWARLGELATVRFGIKTGANVFFYLDEARIQAWGIEPEFLQPVLFSLKEVRRPGDSLERLRFHLFSCHRPLAELEGTRAAAYIRWGQSQGFHRRRTCAGRPLWYSVGRGWTAAPFIFPAKVGQRMIVVRNRRGVLEDKKLYGLTPLTGSYGYWGAVLNSTLCRLFLDLSCRQLTGAQAIADVDVRVVRQLPVPHPESVPLAELEAAYQQLATRPTARRIRDECARPDRRTLDDVIFDALGLTSGERQAVYEAVIDLVEARLRKAAGQ
ncbi:MAG: Eco57I restriction-modification methylase domain-containing protein [Anaerolineae bacterium]